MKNAKRLKIAIQKNGRLNNDSMDLLSKCGIKIRPSKNSLLCHAENFPLDVLFVRDDDIPTLVLDGICDLGIVGENVFLEKIIDPTKKIVKLIKKLGFSRCRLSIAIPNHQSFVNPNFLEGLTIATSYPNLLSSYLKKNKINAKTMYLTGSVEIAPRLNMADAICDLVSTGRTLEENNLKEVDQVIISEAVLIKKLYLDSNEKLNIFNLLFNRIQSVLKAKESKYIMFHAPKSSLELIKTILPGCETPTILPLVGFNEKMAVHVVTSELNFWMTLEKLKTAGATSILVMPIEKMLA